MKLSLGRSVKIGVKQYFSTRDMRGKSVLDMPAGKGRMTGFLQSLGANVTALDLFTHGTVVSNVTIKQADLMKVLPVPTDSIDYVLCQEGIEHLPNQLMCLREFNRILKPDGKLIVTTPNFSSLRSRFSFFFVENNSLKHFPSNEIDGVVAIDADNIGFHHVFLIGIQKLRVLARVSHFKIKKIHPTKFSGTSLFLFVLLYPAHIILNIVTHYRTLQRRKKTHPHGHKEYIRVSGEILRINLNPVVLLGNHLFVEFEKVPATILRPAGEHKAGRESD
jgi:SAM-dependent methyltransferase